MYAARISIFNAFFDATRNSKTVRFSKRKNNFFFSKTRLPTISYIDPIDLLCINVLSLYSPTGNESVAKLSNSGNPKKKSIEFRKEKNCNKYNIVVLTPAFFKTNSSKLSNCSLRWKRKIERKKKRNFIRNITILQQGRFIRGPRRRKRLATGTKLSISETEKCLLQHGRRIPRARVEG